MPTSTEDAAPPLSSLTEADHEREVFRAHLAEAVRSFTKTQPGRTVLPVPRDAFNRMLVLWHPQKRPPLPAESLVVALITFIGGDVDAWLRWREAIEDLDYVTVDDEGPTVGSRSWPPEELLGLRQMG